MVAHLRKWMTVEEFVRLFDLIGDDNADGPFFDAMADEMETLFPENPLK